MKVIHKNVKKKWILGLTLCACFAASLGSYFYAFGTAENISVSGEPIISPRYVYDTSIAEATLGVGSAIALPKATVLDTVDETKAPDGAKLTVSHNGETIDGFDGVETYAENFTFDKAGKYEFTYSHSSSTETATDSYTILINESAPAIVATERTPYTAVAGTVLSLPKVSFTLNGGVLAHATNIYYPDGSAYAFSKTTLTDSGLYQIEFRAVTNGTVYSYVKLVYAYGTNSTFTGDSLPYYGAPSFENELKTMKSYTDKTDPDPLTWSDGLNVSFEKSDVFTYEKPISLSQFGANEKLVEFFVKPTGNATTYYYVELVDANDPTNVLSVRFSSVPTYNGSRHYRTYASASATGIGQWYAGSNVDKLFVNRPSGGAYVATDISGLIDTELYYPLSFAYDEETKQVKIGNFNRPVQYIVADMDDTETKFELAWNGASQVSGGLTGFFTDAWEGFSSDEVYLRMYVDGTFSGKLDTTITKIGGYSLKPDFSSLLPAVDVAHKSEWTVTEEENNIPYYGEIAFKDMLSSGKTYPNGINVFLDKSDTFTYPEVVDLSALSSTDELFMAYIKPLGTEQIFIYADLIDENDPTNVLSVRFASVLNDANLNRYRAYVTAAATGISQPYTGLYYGTTLHSGREIGGYYTGMDISGTDMSLYTPLGFAYDETTKQVFSWGADVRMKSLVADMDDTTTEFSQVLTDGVSGTYEKTGFFTTAWSGFSSNKVYLRLRVIGASTPVSITITRVGNNDISSFEYAPTVEYGEYTFDGVSAPYYGAPSFEEDMTATDSYASGKIVWTDGLNISLERGNMFEWNKLIDLSTIASTDKLFTFYIKPTGNANTFIYVELIDENDPTNVLSVRFACTGTNDYYRTYATAAATKLGQPYTGLYKVGTEHLHYDRINGGYYTSVDLSGNRSDLYYPLHFGYDESTKQVYSFTLGNAVAGIVADMDDTTTVFENVFTDAGTAEKQTGYFTTAWNGFSSNKVYLKMYAETMSSLPVEVLITKIGNEDLSQTGKAETTLVSNAIIVDTGEFLLDEIPNAIVGKPYALFPATAYDVTGRALTIKTRIYYGNTSIQFAHDNVSFIPTKTGIYKIVLTATDRYGYTATTQYFVTAVTEDVAEIPTVTVNDTDGNVTTGLRHRLPDYTTSGGVGRLQTRVDIFFGGKLVETLASENGFFFTPTRNGKYTVTYTVTDYVGASASQSIELTSVAQNEPIFEGEAELPDVMVNGWSYTLPKLYAIDYTGDEPQHVEAVVFAYDSRNGYEITNGIYIPSVEKSEKVKLVYVVTTANGTAMKEYTVLVQKTKEGDELRVGEFFLGDNATISVNEAGVFVTAEESSAGVSFINPLVIGKNGLTIGFDVPASANAFDCLDIRLMDSENAMISVRFTVYKGSDEAEIFSAMSVNGGKANNKIPGSFLNSQAFELNFDNLTCQVSAWNGMKTIVTRTEDGQPFEGFPSSKVYVEFRFGTVEGKAQLGVLKLNNQSLNSNIVKDNMPPQIAIMGEYGGMAKINTEVKVLSALASDVLAESSTVTVTVRKQGGSVQTSVDGIILSNVDASREYRFIPTEFGTYLVTFTAKDSNGRTTTSSYNVTVEDLEGPEIILYESIPERLVLTNGSASFTLPTVKATDASGCECRVVINLKNPTSVMERIEGDTVTFTQRGRYVLYISAYDSSNNLTVRSFDIVVE